MANKDKLLSSAQKFLSKGQLPKAVGEYRKLVDAFPKDIRNRQKLAELLNRAGRNEEALKEYETVAKHYSDAGFYLKAIAVYKQMQKVDPSRVDIYHQLAELNEKQGLIGNALSEYRNLVAFYESKELFHESINILEKMARIDSKNLTVMAKMVEMFMTAGLRDEAAEKFQEIVAFLMEQNEPAKIIKLYERFLDLCSEDDHSRLPLAMALSQSGTPEKAIALIKEMLKLAPDDLEINMALARAYAANDDFGNARLTINHILRLDEANPEAKSYFLKLCLDFGELNQFLDHLKEWKNTFLQQEDPSLFQLFQEDLEQRTANDPQVEECVALLDEFLSNTSHKASALPAENNSSSSRAADALSETESSPEHSASNVEELDPEEGLIDLSLDDVELLEDEPMASSLEEKAPASELEEVELEIKLDHFEELNETGDWGLDDDAPKDEEAFESQEDHKLFQEPESLVELVELEELEELTEFEPLEEVDLELEQVEELDEIVDIDEIDEINALETLSPVIGDHAEKTSTEKDAGVHLETELEEAEYYFRQGLYSDALNVIQQLMATYPENPTLQSKLEEIEASRAESEEATETTNFRELIEDIKDDDLLSATEFLDSFGAGIEVHDEVSQKKVSELESSDTESHFNLGIAYKEMGLFDDAIKEFDKASQDPSRLIDCITLKGQCQSESGLVDDALESFKSGLSQSHLSPEACMTLNFELGQVYQKKGQLLEALEVYQLVAEKDSFFRNVSELIKALRQELGLSDSEDEGPQGDRDRVSYI